MPAAICFTALRNNIMLSAGSRPSVGAKHELALARPELDLDRAQRQAQRQHVAAEDIDHRLHLVEALLGQILVAVESRLTAGRLTGLAGILRREFRVFELEDVELDLEAGDES